MFLNNFDKQISVTNGTNTIGDWLEVSHNKDPPQDNENVLGSPGPIFCFSIPGAQLIANSESFFFQILTSTTTDFSYDFVLSGYPCYLHVAARKKPQRDLDGIY